MNIWQFGRMEVSGHSREWSAVLVTFLHQLYNLSHPEVSDQVLEFGVC